MINLISDTVTLPNQDMLETILSASLGDAGREGPDGRGEDLTTNALEDLAAGITGKEAAAFFPTGTMANSAALLTYCSPGDTVLVDGRQHMLVSEKVCFDDRYFRLIPVCYHLSESGGPDTADVERLLNGHNVRLLCIENTHNFSGGKCIPIPVMAQLADLCAARSVPIHLDGARLFNAAESLKASPAELCKYCDTVMFCISKGLGAPIGSLLCGGAEFIAEARNIRKLLGGTMRQSGIAAACGIYALKHNVARLADDRLNAVLTAGRLKGLNMISVDPEPQSNILLFNLSESGITGEEFCRRLERRGVRGSVVTETEVRLVFHMGVTAEDAVKAADAIIEVDQELHRMIMTPSA